MSARLHAQNRFGAAVAAALAAMIALCTVLPLSAARAEGECVGTAAQRLQWLLTAHDIRNAIHAEPVRSLAASEKGKDR